MPSRDVITLRGMRFHTQVGVLPHEGQLPQPLEVDLTVYRTRPAADPAAPAPGVLDYRELYDIVAEAVGAAPLAYLEDVAEMIAGRALDRESVSEVRVAVRKPHVALPGPLEYAEVVVERERRA